MTAGTWMRRTMLRGVAVLGVITGVLWLPGTASAHPLGNFSVNVFAGIRLSPGEVGIEHVVELAEIPTVQITPEIDTDEDGTTSDDELSAWAWSTARGLVPDLALAVDGEPVTLSVVSAAAAVRPGQGGLLILRLASTFEGRIPDGGEISFRDDAFADRVGWREITAAATDGAELVRSTVPERSVTGGLRTYPRDVLASPLDVREAVVAFESDRSTADRSAVDAPALPRARAEPVGGAFAGLATRHGPFMLLALLLALGIGTLHALGPGHGKTLMAAYLLGSGGRLRDAVAVGATVAGLHTASVLALGGVVLAASTVFPVERVYPWLAFVSGVVACSLGLGLLARRVRAERTALRDGDHAGHEHSHEHPGTPPDRVLSWRGIGAIAFAGGILPSPTALVVLLGSIALDRVAYGLALIGAFSLGLAAALVVIGVVASWTGAAVSRRWSNRSVALVGVVSASTIAVAGFALAVRGLVQL